MPACYLLWLPSFSSTSWNLVDPVNFIKLLGGWALKNGPVGHKFNCCVQLLGIPLSPTKKLCASICNLLNYLNHCLLLLFVWIEGQQLWTLSTGTSQTYLLPTSCFSKVWVSKALKFKYWFESCNWLISRTCTLCIQSLL